MKKSKIIIPALAMLVMSTAATVTGTVAWFTMNTTAKAEGMVVSAKTSGSLIIKAMDLDTPLIPTSADKATKVVFPSTAHAFYPSTHDWTVGTATGLKYVSNAQNINFETGTRKNNVSGTELTYEGVGADNANYYFDYGVFLAGDGMSMTKPLTISIDNPQLLNINGALSIDFYGAELTSDGKPVPSTTTFLDTLNLAKRYNTAADATDSKTQIVTGDVTIGNSDASKADHGAYGIIMRVYYDGALIQNAVEGNTNATYVACTASDNYSSSILYYTDVNGTAIYPADSNTDLDGLGLYKVDISNNTTTFARSIEFANVAQQTIDVTFSC